MNIIDLKPLSVNDAWKGRRFKTDEYKTYIKHMLLLLPSSSKGIVIPEGKLQITFVFGFSKA